MEEVTGKAIPLRRTRATARNAPPPTPRWTEAVAGRLRSTLEPPRQLWLAGLGGTALTLRTARHLWAHLVAEGAAAETWLRRTVGRGH